MAGEPSRLSGQRGAGAAGAEREGAHMSDTTLGQSKTEVDSDRDAEEDSEEDAEGEEEDVDNVQTPAVAGTSTSRSIPAMDDEQEDEDAEGESAPESEDNASEAAPGSASEDSDAESEGAKDWERESEAASQAGHTVIDPNNCIYCGQKEEDDPSEEFELYMSCTVCGDNAHRQCARDADSLQPDDDPAEWRCTNCVDKDLHPEPPLSARSRSDAPKLTRDLLPSHRGGTKPDSHSVFNTLILDDDPMDGSRSLRKRKSSLENGDVDTSPRSTRKRRKTSEADSNPDPAVASVSPTSNIVVETTGLDQMVETAFADEKKVARNGASNKSSSRPRRTARASGRLSAYVPPAHGLSLMVTFTVSKEDLTKILSRKPRKKKPKDRKKPPPPPIPEPSHYPSIQVGNFMPPWFGGFNDRETDDSKSKPYGGILTEEEADTSRTFPSAADRMKFEEARMKAEEDWQKKVATAAASLPEQVKLQKSAGSLHKIKCINFGGYEIDTWYTAPYPEDFMRNRVLYICEFCLKYMNSDFVAWRHKLKCPVKHPPGDEIYRDGAFSFFEVDGRKNPVYCQNLCLLAKLFLGSKTLFYDVEPFLFYVMTETDEFGCHFVGYFSKEKRSSSMNNVSCILVLPIHQRRGFGHMLIDFSYLLTRVEQKVGSPEKPLSDMGLVSYRSYWRLILCYHLIDYKGKISITGLSDRTGITPDDVIATLEALRALVRDPVTKTYALRLDKEYFRSYIDNYEKKGYAKINPQALVWTPYVMNYAGFAHYEDGPAIHTVAQRDNEDDGMLTNGNGPLMRMQAAEKLQLTLNGIDVSATEASTPNPEHALVHTPGLQDFNSAPGTPQDSVLDSAASIPPTRFEVFPPIPGVTRRRGPGRPYSTGAGRKRGGRSTPRKSNPSTPSALPGLGKPSFRLPSRRTRSRLGNDGANDDEDEATPGAAVARNGLNGLTNGHNAEEAPAEDVMIPDNDGSSAHVFVHNDREEDAEEEDAMGGAEDEAHDADADADDDEADAAAEEDDDDSDDGDEEFVDAADDRGNYSDEDADADADADIELPDDESEEDDEEEEDDEDD